MWNARRRVNRAIVSEVIPRKLILRNEANNSCIVKKAVLKGARKGGLFLEEYDHLQQAHSKDGWSRKLKSGLESEALLCCVQSP